MAHFAELDSDNIVIRVLVVDNRAMLDADGNEVEQLGIDALPNGNWKQTSYNTKGGVHKHGGVAFRKNYAGIGYTYDSERDAFCPPQPFPSWTLNEETYNWNPPVPMPDIEEGEDGRPFNMWQWNEDELKWDKVEMPSG